MDQNKDYYRILGVLEDTEDIVIKAAYKALAQKYHPDKFQGNPKIAECRMKEINEAYSVLSDPSIRKQYDEARIRPEYEDNPYEETDDLLHTLDKDWLDATEYLPDLVDIALDLSKYSKELEFTFKVILIENKDFNNREKIAERIKKDYLQKYFGTNNQIHSFAERLFNLDRRDILKELNRAVNLLGSNIDPKVIIGKLSEGLVKANKHRTNKSKHNDISSKYALELKKYDAEYELDERTIELSKKFLESIGIEIVSAGLIRDLFNNTPYLAIRPKENDKVALTKEELVKFALFKIKQGEWD